MDDRADAGRPQAPCQPAAGRWQPPAWGGPAWGAPSWGPPGRGMGRWRRRGGPWRRPQRDRMVGGVAAGLAARTGCDITVVRVAFVLASLASGFGLAAYVLGWLLVPAEGEDRSIGSRALSDRRGLALAAGVASLLAVLLLPGYVLGVAWLGAAAWPLIIAGAGATLVWRNSSAQEQEVIRRFAEPLRGVADGGRARSALRLLVAALLLAGGLTALLAGRHAAAALQPLGGAALVIAAIVVSLGPWWLRIARDLVVERQARARAEERAELAARVHDSVLQTLALIQRRADDPQQVTQLARAQERDLRAWLFDGRAPGSLDGQAATFADGVRLIQREVEAQHQIPVEAVTVGDCELDDDLAALLAAGREAAVNAAKWSGAPVVSVFAEVEASVVSLFVRDRGRGFDPAAVPPDRKGLAESVHARMARRGGAAAVHSTAGEGTEVSLTMPRPAGARQPVRA